MYFKVSIFFAFYAFLLAISSSESASDYFGKFLGPLKNYHHGVTGDVYVVDSRTIHIRNFNYDGEGPAAYFYVSNGKTPNEGGTKIRDERGSNSPLKKYRKKHITLTLPEGKTITNIKHLYVWCDEFSVNFADIKIPKNLDFPKPQKIGKLEGIHGVSSDNVLVVDAQTLLIPSFSYDGEAPDAKFWVGSGNKPSPQGVKVPDENGKEDPLRKYTKKTIVLTLPGDLTIFDIGHFGVWCEAFTVDFGHLLIPKGLNVPPSLKMLGVSPQSKLNCEILYDDLAFEVRWAVAGDSIVIQLVAKLEKGEYMSFGVSGQIDRNTMVGGDVVVAWIDHETLNGYAYDYYLDAKSQCAGNRGSCPDVKLRSSTESIRLLNAALVNGYSIVTYQRPLRAHDEFDLPIYTNGSQAIIWAIGPLNSLQEVSYHSITSKVTTLIDFGRPPQWNCPIPESDAAIADSETNERYNEPTYTTSEHYQVHTETSVRTRVTEQKKKETEATKTTPISKKVEATPAPVKREKPWDIPPIQCNEPDDGVYYAQMGPTGGKRGYSAITGHVGWGISWYINGLLIPEINVVRGRTYTFVVEGGLDPEIPAKYHPFYITDDPVGGFVYKTPEEKEKIQLFAGVTQNKEGEYVPTGVGRLCNWTPDPDQPSADEFASFGAYQRTLSLVCDHGEPGVIQWTPDENTPDTVYYQCFSHRYLGWKINVHDTCDKDVAESEQVTTRVRADSDADSDELISNPSIQVITRVKPSNASLFNSLSDLKQEGKNNVIPEQGQLKDGLKGEFAQSEKFILQDPYLPPPPYQKNFDYQSMQSTEPMREIRPVSERVEYKEYTKSQDLPMSKAYPPQDLGLKGFAQDYPSKGYSQDFPIKNYPQQDMPLKAYSQDLPMKTYNPYYVNTTTPQVAYLPTNMLKYPKAHFKEPFALPANNMKIPLYADAPYKYQIPPAMHIHVIKHAGEPGAEDQVPAMSKPYPMGRPYRHSVVIKKPIHKVKPPPYSHMRVNKIPKQNGEQQQASSNSVKSVLPPSMRNVVSNKIPPQVNIPINAHVYTPTTPARKTHTHAPHHHHPTTRKKEESQTQVQIQHVPVKQYLTKVEEPHPENHKYPSPPTQGGFNPSSIVIESGFKPIIPNIDNQNVAQDRMSEDVEDYIDQDPPSKEMNSNETSNETNSSEDHSKNPFEGKEPELFEPMFIPSPLINEHHRKKKPHDQHMKVKLHKPGQSNIVYIWPNGDEEDIPSASIKQPSYFNYYTVDTVSNPIYNKPYEKNESPQQGDNLVENIAYQMPKQTSSTSHTYKVTEFHENVHPEISEMNNSTEKAVPEEEKNIPSNHKIKYIPLNKEDAQSQGQDDKFVINIPDNQSTESTNSTKS